MTFAALSKRPFPEQLIEDMYMCSTSQKFTHTHTRFTDFWFIYWFIFHLFHLKVKLTVKWHSKLVKIVALVCKADIKANAAYSEESKIRNLSLQISFKEQSGNDFDTVSTLDCCCCKRVRITPRFRATYRLYTSLCQECGLQATNISMWVWRESAFLETFVNTVENFDSVWFSQRFFTRDW